MSYAVLICARNEQEYIENCLQSVISQTIQPTAIVLIDDGSNDETTEKAAKLMDKGPLKILHHPDRGFNALGTYYMADPYNLGLKHLSEKKWDFLLIMGADTEIPPYYMEQLLEKITPQLGVVSGKYPGIPDKYATATGRLIRREIIQKMGGRLPRNYAWESTVTHYAKYLGYKERSFPIPIKTRKPGHVKRSYTGWGKANKELGYTLPHILHRFYVYLKAGKTYIGLQIIYGYLIHRPHERPEWTQFINDSQRESTKRKLKQILNKLTLNLFSIPTETEVEK